MRTPAVDGDYHTREASEFCQDEWIAPIAPCRSGYSLNASVERNCHLHEFFFRRVLKRIVLRHGTQQHEAKEHEEPLHKFSAGIFSGAGVPRSFIPCQPSNSGRFVVAEPACDPSPSPFLLYSLFSLVLILWASQQGASWRISAG